ncbi:MAG: hypothetical protein PVG89_14380 [Gammaproteobacteria bacterium]|jgi:hypothetical protein
MEAHFTSPREERHSEENVLVELPPQSDYQLKYEVIVLIYRLAAMAVGTVLMIVGYLLFINLAVDNGDLMDIGTQWWRIGLPAVSFIAGIIICVAGFTRWMPLPKYRVFDNGAFCFSEKQSEAQIPVLAPLNVAQLNDKVWSKNVKPLMVKIANKEHITSSERELLRNWLNTH